MNNIQILLIATIAIYLVSTIVIGAVFNKKGSGGSSSDFFIGGRKLGPFVTAMSAEASDMSSYLLMGLPGLAYLAGLAEVTWTAIGLAVGTYLNFLIVAKCLRRYTAKIGAITVPEFFNKRYDDKKHRLSMAAALIILIFFVPYTASGFKAVGTLFNSLFGFDYHVSMLIGAAIIVAYTTLGGFLAVSTTDLIQSIFMTVALIVIIFFGIDAAGGLDTVVANAKELPGYLNIFEGYNAATGTASSFKGLTIVSTLAWGLGYFGMPHILLRFMAIRDEKLLTTSRRIASVWVVISMGIAILIGVIGFSLTMNGTIPNLATSSESETVIIKIADVMSKNGVLFAIVAGIILAGILAATMSTADSQLLAAASSVCQDLLKDCFGIQLSQKTAMRLARLTVIIIAVIGVVLAWNPNSSVFRIVSFAWAGFGAAFGPTILLALFWRRSNKNGALAGIVGGAAAIFIWKFLLSPMGGVWGIYELLPGFIIGLVLNVVVSLVTAAPEKGIVEIYDEVHKKA
ncbi:MAG: sodium/proline symporter [Lachnospiraceae bacterium]|nr:sodium/proline symporter [Lachnospiraceae bacterium]